MNARIPTYISFATRRRLRWSRARARGPARAVIARSRQRAVRCSVHSLNWSIYSARSLLLLIFKATRFVYIRTKKNFFFFFQSRKNIRKGMSIV